MVKNLPANTGDMGSIPGWGRSLGEEIGYPLQYSWASLVAQTAKNPPAMWETWFNPCVGKTPLQYSCLENSMDRGAWRDIVHGVMKESDTT